MLIGEPLQGEPSHLFIPMDRFFAKPKLQMLLKKKSPTRVDQTPFYQQTFRYHGQATPLAESEVINFAWSTYSHYRLLDSIGNCFNISNSAIMDIKQETTHLEKQIALLERGIILISPRKIGHKELTSVIGPLFNPLCRNCQKHPAISGKQSIPGCHYPV